MKKNALYNFLQSQRAKLQDLQDLSFERNEKRLKQLLETNVQGFNYPFPTFLPILLIWIFVLLFPLIMIIDTSYMPNHEINIRSLAAFYVPLVLTALIFQLNQRFFVPDSIFKKQYAKYFIWNSFVVLIALFLREIIFFLIDKNPNEGIAYFFNSYCFSFVKGHFTLWTILSFVILVGFVCFICVIYHIMLRQILKNFILREQNRSKLQYELDFLKNQLSPHFLFNTLNNISALISIDKKKAEISMAKLSSLLRITLYQTSEKLIPIEEDVEILKKYADLEKLRLDENYDLQINVEFENPQFKVAPLISMPLMENSIKHSIGYKRKSFAHIKIIQKNNEVLFIAENSNNPHQSKNKAFGLGLATFKKRLDLTYLDKYEYTVESNENTYKCILKIWN